MANGSNNARFLAKIDSGSRSMILENIAKHYGISTSEAFAEVTNSESEHLLDYMTEPARSAASVLMQRHNMRGFSRPGEKDMMAREVVARKGSKRVELSGPQADGRWVVTVMQEEKQVVPGEANDRFVESKWYSTEAGARRAASKILASRPGEKDMMANDQAMALYRKLNASGTAITNSNWREWERMASAAMKMQDFTPPGQSDSLHDLANDVGIEIQALKSRASRPGAKATFKVEDRFYFGKGRKERFWARGYDDAKDRVRRSPELGKYAKIIMQPEFDTADHWEWVSRASTSEIVNWAKSISRDM